ncbi:twin-arginine translocase TatA/TatE family subunit [Paraconexibacter algicola]|uniref:Sec-independent protein translocase protein TatA n=1 Tax=Paraconexibacter algicola TaxID=2133960 RepID=A0A2T4UIU5_9ACTN|nr:twin-arginine translocase TatA/TatE family subunit [Paraconexibacter algicola]PTL59149.1 twin-arginine translocase TatA/TatE family subunit [Paraconexibacter algicola]
MPNVGPMEIIIVVAIALIVLGPRKLPEAGRGLGRGLREFKEAIGGLGDDPAPVASVADERARETTAA